MNEKALCYTQRYKYERNWPNNCQKGLYLMHTLLLLYHNWSIFDRIYGENTRNLQFSFSYSLWLNPRKFFWSENPKVLKSGSKAASLTCRFYYTKSSFFEFPWNFRQKFDLKREILENYETVAVWSMSLRSKNVKWSVSNWPDQEQKNVANFLPS